MFADEVIQYFTNRYRKRNVRLAVIIDQDLVANPLWEEKRVLIENTLARVNDVFKREFNIRFSVASTPIFSYNPDSLSVPYIWVDDCLINLNSQRTMFAADILFMVTDKMLIRLYNQDGQPVNKTEKIAYFKQVEGTGSTHGIAIVQLLPPEYELKDEPNTELWCHEIGHVFGAEHIENPKSVMSTDVLDFLVTTLTFDPKNKKTILRNKFKRFSKEYSL
jgi:hypothetical protein